MPVHIEKKVEIWSDVTVAGRTDGQTKEQGKIKLLSQWTMDGWDEQYVSCWAKYCKLMHEIKNTCQVFGPKRVTFGNQGHDTLSLSSGQTTTYWKTKGIQSYLRIWGCYDPIESGPSETKKGGLYRCSVKKSDFGAIFWPKNGPWRPPGDNPAMRSTQKGCLLGVPRW